MDDQVLLTLTELRTTIRGVLDRIGLNDAHAGAVADTLVAGEAGGSGAHGLYRLLMVIRSVRGGVVAPDPVPVAHHPAPALVRIDGGNGFAPLPFRAGLPLLVERARRHGIAALALNRVAHFAALWPEAEALAREGLAALAFTPSHAWVAPHGGTRPVFGTNPIAFGWPRPATGDGAAGWGDPFVFDFATSAAARGEIELHRRAAMPTPEDWGLDPEGRPTTDAAAILAGAMLPFGGHKGSALAAMVELIAGPLIGDLTSAESMALDNDARGAPLGGELVIAIDPAGFLGGAVAANLGRAEAMFASITGQGARLPSLRRYAARRRAAADGVRVPRALLNEIEAAVG